MAGRTIPLAAGADAQTVLHTARTALERKGYRWIPTSGRSAEAHRGGQKIASRRMARHLLLGLTVTGGLLVLRRQNSGWGWAVPLGALMAMRIRREFRRAVRTVGGALREARLAP